MNSHLLPKRFLVYFLFLSVCSLSWAYDACINGIYYYLIFENGRYDAWVTSGYGDNWYSGSVVIPSAVTYNGKYYQVTAIVDGAFGNCTELTSVTIPNSVISIWGAFGGCTGLTSVTIGNNVEYIGMNAFGCCTSLTSVIIPNSVHFIDVGAFEVCTSLKSVTIGNSVTTIMNGAFADCTSLTSITIPNNVDSIADGVFKGCTGLTSVTISNRLKSIDSNTFSGCTRLTSVTIPNSVTSIGNAAFKGCSSLTSVTIPESVTNIGEGAFDGCKNITKANFASIESLCKIKFANNQSNPIYYVHHLYVDGQEVTEVVVPESVTSIGQNSFYDCTGLKSISMGNSVRNIGDCAFRGCNGLTSITIPESVTSIGEYAFEDCTDLTSISIPNSVTSIGMGALDNTAWYNNQPNGYVYAGKCLYCYKGKNSATDITIKDGIVGIAGHVFQMWYNLSSVIIPNSVTCIGNLAFHECTNLKSVTIGNKIENIGDWAFRDCKNLKKVICMAERVPKTDPDAFLNSGISSATLYVPASALDDYKSTAPWSRFGTITPLPCDFVSDNVYYKINENKTSVSVACQTAAYNSYSGSVVIPATVKYNDKEYNVTAIGDNAFRTCAGLISVSIPESVTIIGDYAFSSCSLLSSVTIPNSVTSIGKNAFVYCSNLTSITISSNVTNIGDNAFYACRALKEVYCRAEQVPTMNSNAFNNTEVASATLYVPESVIDDYKSTAPWSGFGTILALGPATLLGDANDSGAVEIGDITSVLTLMANPDATGYNNKAADANGNGSIEIGDITTILTIMAGE